jgi:hypothetical protein
MIIAQLAVSVSAPARHLWQLIQERDQSQAEYLATFSSRLYKQSLIAANYRGPATGLRKVCCVSSGEAQHQSLMWGDSLGITTKQLISESDF